MTKRTPKDGPAVFYPHDKTRGQVGMVKVGGKLLRVRLPSDPPIRDRTKDYGKARGEK